MSDITRITPGPRMSAAVVHGDTVYVGGTVDDSPEGGVRGQTERVLAKIDARLAAAGTTRAKALYAQVWLADIATFEQMNAVWDAWVDKANPPARATVEARLARPEFLVEIAMVAAR